jgi:hypothetical protein
MHCPSGITDAHNQKKRRIVKKEKSRNDLFSETTVVTPPRQHQKSSFFKSNASKKGTVHKRHRRPIIDLRFSPWRKSSLSKQYLQQDHCRHNQLRPDLGFSS